MDEKVNVYLSCCTWRELDVAVTASLHVLDYSDDPDFNIHVATGDALISRARSIQATQFLMNPEYGDIMVFVDSDIVFSPEDVINLVKRVDDEHPIVGGMYMKREDTAPSPAIRLGDIESLDIGEAGQDLIEIVYASTGFVAFHRKVLEKMTDILPMCVTGMSQQMWPFFDAAPFDHGYETPERGFGIEYLSEDWAFCEIANKLGFKTYLDPSIRLGHKGQRTFWPDDMKQDALATTYVVTEGHIDRTRLLRDYAKFFGIELTQAMELFQQVDSRRALADEFVQYIEDVDTKTPSITQIKDFYKNAGNTLLSDVRSNLAPSYFTRIGLTLHSASPVTVIGGGIGTIPIHLAETTYGDITIVAEKSDVREFAEFRVGRHKVEDRVKFVSRLADVRTKPHTILAVDILAYMHPDAVRKTLKQAYDILNNGGTFIFIDDMINDPLRLNMPDTIVKMIKEVGFQHGPVRWTKTL
tara:strand:+ start:13 stop:1422 length:1410 start_codon:yes stop_codon:yes gene_type:complete